MIDNIYDAIRACASERSIPRFTEAFDFLISRGYAYDCEYGKYEIFRNKYTGHEAKVQRDMHEMITPKA